METFGIQAKSLRWALLKRLKYVAFNSGAAYLPLYLVSSFAAHQNIVIDPRLFVFSGFLCLFILLAGSLLVALEYALLRIALGRHWRAAPPGALCFARLIEFRESLVRKRSCMIGKDEDGIFQIRRGVKRRLCPAPYTVLVHDKLGVFAPFIVGKVKLRPYLQIEGGSERHLMDVLSPRDLVDRLAWSEGEEVKPGAAMEEVP